MRVKRTRGKLLIFILMFCIISLTYGEVNIGVDKTMVGIGETINMSISMEKKQNYDIENIENFKILSRYSKNNISYINGKKSSLYTDTYQIMASEVGIFSLKAVTGKEDSNVIKIEVSRETATPFSEKQFYIKISPEKDTYYFGEKIPYTESLITTVSLQGIDYLERPDFGDLSVVQIDPRGKIGNIQSRTTYNGREAIDIGLYQGLLEPSSSGIKEVGGSLLRLTLDGSSNYSRRSENLAGEKKQITILSLPPGAPINFSNLVGNLEGETSFDRTSVKRGEAATMTVVLSGSASLTNLKDIVEKRNPDFNIYENIISTDEWIEDNLYNNEKTYQIAFVPKKVGNLETPRIEIPYFNTAERKYSNFIIEGREIEVGESSLTSTSLEDSTSLDLIDTSREEINISMLPESTPPTSNRWLIVTLIAIVIVQGGGILYLIRDKLSFTRKDDILKNLKKSSDDKEFYENYCIFMKRNHNFNPKAHSSERLDNKELREINIDIEESRFHGRIIKRKEVIDRLKNVENQN